MVDINQNKKINFSKNNAPEITLNSNLKDGFLEILAYGNLIEPIFLKKAKNISFVHEY